MFQKSSFSNNRDLSNANLEQYPRFTSTDAHASMPNRYSHLEKQMTDNLNKSPSELAHSVLQNSNVDMNLI